MIRNLLLAAALALPVAAAAQDGNPQVVLRTTMGEITLELDKRSAPVTVDNFLKYVQAGHYDGTIFHRVIDNFMIQGGGYTAELTGRGTRAAIMNEAPNGLKNTRGTIAMARTAEPHSATAQFFINVVDNLPLDSYGGGYAVFGKVVAGMDVVDRIKATPTVNKGAAFANLPATDVVIHKATLED